MPEQLYGLTRDDIVWLRQLRRDLDSGQARLVRRREAASAPNAQYVKASSTTPTDGRYPGHWYEYDPAAKTFTQMNEVWIVAPNGTALDTSNYYESNQHGFENSRPVFSAPDAVVGGGGSGSITVEEQDGSPSYSSITKLVFDQADGFVVTNPVGGSARIDIAAATSSQAGIVSTTTQSLGGTKSFLDGIKSKDYLQLFDATLATVTVDFDLITSASPFNSKCYISAVDSNDDEVQLYFALASGVIISATDDTSLVDASYGVQDSGGTVYFGDWGTDPVGNVVKGGLITTVSSSSAPTWVSAPSTTSSTGTAGQMAYGFTLPDWYLYVCVATNSWRRVLLSTW